MLPSVDRRYIDAMKDLPISRLMNKPLVTIAPDDTLGAALKLMEEQRMHHLLVMDGSRMAGILSSADLLKLALFNPLERDGAARPIEESLELKVRDLMQTHVAVLRAHSTLRQAAQALALGGFHALPVLAIDGAPVGIVTTSDLIALLLDQIERDGSGSHTEVIAPVEAQPSAMRSLIEVLRAAEIYLHSGQSGQQHAKLSLAVVRARESIRS